MNTSCACKKNLPCRLKFHDAIIGLFLLSRACSLPPNYVSETVLFAASRLPNLDSHFLETLTYHLQLAFTELKSITKDFPVSKLLPIPSCRTALKAGLAAGTASVVVVAAAQKASAGAISSPLTTPFLEPMPITPLLPERQLTDPAFAKPPTVAPNRDINPATGKPFEGRGEPHQLRSLNPPQKFFAQRFGAVPAVSIHPQLAKQINFWGANLGGADLGTDKPMTPMPTIVSRYQAGANTAILVRRFNNLPTGAPSGGFGKNSISMHTHNFHSAPDSDGGPCDPGLGALSENPKTQGRFFFPGQYYDYYYNMKRAGFTSPAYAPTATFAKRWAHFGTTTIAKPIPPRMFTKVWPAFILCSTSMTLAAKPPGSNCRAFRNLTFR